MPERPIKVNKGGQTWTVVDSHRCSKIFGIDESAYHIGKENGSYYEDIAGAADWTVGETRRLAPWVELYQQFVERDAAAPARSQGEYRLEPLAMALYHRNYGVAAAQLGEDAADFSLRLLDARRRYPNTKPRIDALRGLLNEALFPKVLRKLSCTEPPVAAYRLDMVGLGALIQWTAATGEFSGESRQLERWRRFLLTQAPDSVRAFFRAAAVCAFRFERLARSMLGRYTEAIDRFKARCKEEDDRREELILRARYESDYHLNMVGAEIMNRALRARFDQTERKVVLLPGCMRPTGHSCKAEQSGALRCVRCRPDCNIGDIAARSNGRFEVRLILHASDVSEALRPWQRQSKVGVVASACVLHLLTGGYAMEALEIPSQCVLLESPGCRHWHAEGVPTRVDVSRLLEIVAGAEIKTVPEVVGDLSPQKIVKRHGDLSLQMLSMN